MEVEFCGEITRKSPVLVFYVPGGCCKNIIDRRANHNCRAGCPRRRHYLIDRSTPS